jgi:2-dehydropantoate 2-reductase
MDSVPHVLIVGAGAIGQVYGALLAAGGAQVSVLVKEKHAAEAARGFTLHELRRFGAPRTQQFVPHSVVTELGDVAAQSWDQIWLCVPSDALEADFLQSLAEASEAATWVSAHVGPNDVERLERAVGARLVLGPILVLAYSIALGPKDDFGPGTRYWRAPLPHQFSGAERVRVSGVVRALGASGTWTRRVRDTTLATGRSAAVLIPLVAALTLSAWSFRALRRGKWLGVALAAARECVQSSSRVRNARRPLWSALLRPGLVRIVLWLSERLSVVPLEPFFRFHFSKVEPQTFDHLEGHIRHGRELGLPVECTETLLDALRAKSP